MKNVALNVSGFIFSFIGVIHLVRYVKGWEIIIDHYSIPLSGSIYAGLLAVLLAIWMFAAAKNKS